MKPFYGADFIMIDKKGFRAGVAVIIVNHRKHVLWAKRVGQNAWQFPQGGLLPGESPEQGMYRELQEEVGLKPEDVEVLACSKEWLRYRLPRQMIRYYSKPICIGQKQKYFLLRLVGDERLIRFDYTDSPEFDNYRWVKYWYPLRRVIAFKRKVYRSALQEFAPLLFTRNPVQTMPVDES